MTLKLLCFDYKHNTRICTRICSAASLSLPPQSPLAHASSFPLKLSSGWWRLHFALASPRFRLLQTVFITSTGSSHCSKSIVVTPFVGTPQGILIPLLASIWVK